MNNKRIFEIYKNLYYANDDSNAKSTIKFANEEDAIAFGEKYCNIEEFIVSVPDEDVIYQSVEDFELKNPDLIINYLKAYIRKIEDERLPLSFDLDFKLIYSTKVSRKTHYNFLTLNQMERIVSAVEQYMQSLPMIKEDELVAYDCVAPLKIIQWDVSCNAQFDFPVKHLAELKELIAVQKKKIADKEQEIKIIQEKSAETNEYEKE